MNPLISVVIPTFNREKVLKRAIDSVVSQTYDKWELIIVDNSSVDDTENLVDGYNNPKIKITTIDNDSQLHDVTLIIGQDWALLISSL